VAATEIVGADGDEGHQAGEAAAHVAVSPRERQDGPRDSGEHQPDRAEEVRRHCARRVEDVSEETGQRGPIAKAQTEHHDQYGGTHDQSGQRPRCPGEHGPQHGSAPSSPSARRKAK